ncbi:hypothetical protein [Muriicola sp. Z0-33]|uniref:glucosamine inositolphosphorylceramide transferase family protein n=1 Tax=Muriicola sp. Z0-33 TaxID=2816957 RepID=UPI0022384FD2|nr:hypothetical protein [Muriicola sp. Z0-33]MCW5515614.1 hypothetical protein [Muriicola sp. Z0-33]
MRIGILIREFDSLRNWELRIIDEIRTNPDLELVVLIKDSRTEVQTAKSKFKRAWKAGNLLGKLLFVFQSKIESRIFREQRTVDREEVVAYLKTITTIDLSPLRKGYLDIFSKEDADKVRQFDLDVLLRHEFNIIRGDILNASRYGIWSFHHGDNAIHRGEPAGFWEIILKLPVLGVTLQKLTPELDGGLVIEKSHYNTSFSFVKNNTKILEHSVRLLFKNLNKLGRGEFNPTKSPIYYNRLYRVPTLRVMFGYLLQFYYKLFSHALKEGLMRIFGVRYSCWTLFIGKGSIFDATLFRLKPVKLPKGEFWADPFLYQHKGETYVFFENYSYKKRRGKISCGKIVNKEIKEVIDVLDLDYHLSYPFIFEEEGELYMMPEAHQNKRLEIYKCLEFPHKWTLYSTAFEGESVADATYFKDQQGHKWLFLNKGFNDDHMSELYIYRIDSLRFKEIEAHHQNPVIIDSRGGRNAGSIFEYKNQLIRPSQNNSNGVYGYGLNLNAIKTLTLENYQEEKIIGIEPNFVKGLEATHHLHQLEDMYIIDGAFKRL